MAFLRKNALPVAGILLAFALRVPFLARSPGGWDDVDFALGLRQYDLWLMQPHFPGYPIYMVAARLLFSWWNDNAVVALSWFSAAASALSVIPLYSIVWRISGSKAAGAVCLLWCVDPLSWVLGTQPLSDSFGCLLVIAMIALAMKAADAARPVERRALSLLACGIAWGLLMGVRLSYAPFAAVPLWAGYRFGRATGRWPVVIGSAAVSCLTVGLWMHALVRQAGGFAALWRLALAFTEGHFSDWGGVYHEGEGFWPRLWYWLARQLFAAGIGTPWPQQSPTGYAVLGLIAMSCLGGLGCFPGWSMRRRVGEWASRLGASLMGKSGGFSGLLVAWCVPYAIWAFFAQNVDKPRHVLPLIPLLIWLIVLGLARWKRASPWLISLFAMSVLATAYTQIAEQRTLASPMARLADYLDDRNLSQSGIVYTYEEERVIRYRYPSVATVRLRKLEDLKISLLNQPVLPSPIFVTDQVLNGFHRPDIVPLFREVARFDGSVWLYPTYHQIVLYELLPGKAETLLQLSPDGP